MKVHLAYGKKGFDVDLPEPNIVKVMTLPAAEALRDQDIEIARALQSPIASAPLSEFARKARNACVL